MKTRVLSRFLKGAMVALVAVALTGATARPAKALEFNLDTVFSGNTPDGTGPWLNVTFEDSGANQVLMTVTSLLTGTSQFISQLYFNLDPAIDPTSITESGKAVDSGSFTLPTLSKGTNAFQADGDGKYDLLYDFSTAAGGRFNNSDVMTVTLSATGLTASSFNFLSNPAGGSGPFYIAAHLQGISGGGSSWITTPEPGTVAMLLGFAIPLGLYVRRRASP
jgi:hypothetical protein